MISLYRPQFLWGLLALAIPILIHVLARKRVIELDFSTLRFFKDAAPRASKVRRLKRLLLLCVRCLVIVLAVLVFAKPRNGHDPFAGFSDPNGEFYSWVDPSISMTYGENGKELRQTAYALADSMDRKLPSTARCFRFSHDREAFINAESFVQGKDGRVRYGPTSINAVIADVRKTTKKSGASPMLVIFSDFKRKISMDLENEFSTFGAAFPVIGVSVAPQSPWNYSIKNAFVPRERPNALVGSVSAQGRACREASLSAFAGALRLGQGSMAVNANDHTVFELDISNDRRQRSGFVRLETPDPFQADNVFYFLMNDKKTVRVLVIGDSIKSFPIAAALRSMGKDRWDPVLMQQPQNVGYDDVDSADCIVLNETPFIPKSVQPLFYSRNSPKAFIVSPSMDAATGYGAIMTVRNALKKAARPFMNVTDKALSLRFPDTISFLWKGFHESSGLDVSINQWWGPLWGEPLLNLNNGSPLATHFMDSVGNSWVFFAAPIGLTETNNLCRTGIYPPLMDRLLRYGLGPVSVGADKWIAGTTRRNPYFASKKNALVYNEKGVLIAQWDNQPTVVIEEPGIYRVQPMGEASFDIAVNLDTAESDFEYRLPHAGLATKGLVRVIKSGEFIEALGNRRMPGLDRVLWVCIALMVLAESLLWERPYRA